MRAFILAGGFATRLWPLTESRAKPLLPLAGTPIITSIVRGIPANVPVTVSTNAGFADAFREWAQQLGRDVEVLVEDTAHDDHKLGALGALAHWLQTQRVEDDVLVLTGDNYFGFTFQHFLAAWRPGTALLAAYDLGSLEAAKAFGTVCTGADGKTVTAFVEKPAVPESALVSTGCVLLPKECRALLLDFARRKPDNLGGIFEELLAQAFPVEAFRFTEPWFDIGSFPAYLEATRALVGERAVLAEGAVCEDCACVGSVVLGKGSRAHKCELTNVVLFDDCDVEDCVLRDCILDSGCRLRGVDLTGQMLRAGTVLRQAPFSGA